MKPYPPHLKEKHRYISFKVHAKMTFTENQVKHSIIESVYNLFGESGMASSNFDIVEYEPKTMSGIVRCTKDFLDNIILALTFVKDVQGKIAWCQVLGVSGTIKTCKEKYSYKPPKDEKNPRKERLAFKPSEIMKYAR